MRKANLEHVVIAKSGPDNPRNDTASVLELSESRVMVVWHKYEAGPEGGHDLGICRIHAKISGDGGKTWEEERRLIDVSPGDKNVQAPALCKLPSGELLLICLRAHAGNSTSMWLYRSKDDGKTFGREMPIWEHSSGQWLQGGASSIIRLSSGRLLIPYHGGTGDQFGQHNTVRCFYSDDEGYTWKQTEAFVDLPMRGAMEASVAELDGGKLVMSLRTQLGSVFISYSYDQGETWSLAQASGLKAPESCTCLRRIPGTNSLLLLWNHSLYNPKHHHYGSRTPLSAAISEDEGESWTYVGNMDEGDYEFTNIGCTFLSNGNAVITYLKVEDAGVKNSGDMQGGCLPFVRKGMDLCAAIADKKWFAID